MWVMKLTETAACSHATPNPPNRINRPTDQPTPQRRATRALFSLLRLWSRVLHYLSSLLSIVSGAVSFTVVPAIVLSVLSAGTQVGLACFVLLCLGWGGEGVWSIQPPFSPSPHR
jgi:hypothetical protein